jgi:hypothetical protein
VKHLICLSAALLVAACQTPQSVRTLSRSSSALITETRAAAPAVQQYFAKQDRLVEGRIARWQLRKQRAETFSLPSETLWAMDQDLEDKGNDDRRRTALLAQVRANGAEVPPLAAPRPTAAPASSDPASIAKMTGLLEAIASGKSQSAGFYLTYWQALSSSLQELNKDAAAAVAAPVPGVTEP